MSQYRTGFASVYYGTTTVVGFDTDWLTNVTAGNTFKIEGINAIYDIDTVVSSTCLKLKVPYAHESDSGLKYQIHRDFTPNNRIPEIGDGDRDWPFYMTKAMRVVDAVNYVSTLTQTLYINLNNGSIPAMPDGSYCGITAILPSTVVTSAGSVTMISGALASNSTTTTLPAGRMAIINETGSGTQITLLQGIFKKVNTFNFPTTKVGFPLYVGASGTLTTTALAANLYQQIAGVVLATNTVYFSPSMSIVKT